MKMSTQVLSQSAISSFIDRTPIHSPNTSFDGADGSYIVDAEAQGFWSVHVYMDTKKNETKTLVPCPWVDAINNVFYWPPKGKPLGNYISRWSSPEASWRSFDITETILECGSKEDADQMLNMPSSAEDDNEKIATVQVKFPLRVTSPVASPIADPIGENMDFVNENEAQSPEETFVPRRSPRKKNQHYSNTPDSLKRKKMSNKSLNMTKATPVNYPKNQANNLQNVANNKSPALESMSVELSKLNQTPKGSNVSGQSCSGDRGGLSRNVRKYGDGGNSFSKMPDKHFQYVVLMELRTVINNQAVILERLDALEGGGGNGGGAGGLIRDIVKLDNMQQFDEEEKRLGEKSYMKEKKYQIKAIGGKDARVLIRKALDAMFSRELQSCFSKDGLKGKRAFVKTLHYKCLVGAVIDPFKEGYDKSSIDFLIGDVLKRALRKQPSGVAVSNLFENANDKR